MAVDFKKIEKKWQKRWERQRLHEADVDRKKKKFFTSIIIPYVNGNVHIGHSYTYTRTDVYARFKRMQGYNTLLAQGFHATGEPVVGVVERLKKGDKSQIETFQLYGATRRNIENFRKKGPRFVAEFWAKKIEESCRAAGFSVDWRRKFTLSITPQFSRFVEWQYNTLRKKGYVVQGTHPVIWCPKDQSPTGDHDRLKGEGESPQDYVLLKFQCGDYFLPAATLRPETIYGVTNMWVNPDARYVVLKVNTEKWIVSKYAAEKLKDQLKYAEAEGEFDVRAIIGKKCTEPAGNREIPVLPGKFVDPDSTTGVVMSVPSHAPYDWAALKELLESNELEQFGLSRQDVEPISLIKTPGFGEHPALEITEKMNITSTKQEKELDEATAAVYKKEFHQGTLNENCGPYAGMAVSQAKERLIMDFIEKGIADVMWEPTGEVVCRCTTRCHVKVLENQWFLKYSDGGWKKQVRQHLARMKIYPDEARNNFENTVDWLKDKACARKSGLGTPLPWDKEWIVETLSDSTVYMAYYTVAHIVAKKKIPAAKLADEVFDFVFLGKGDINEVSKKSKIGKDVLLAMREEFEYFYPMDMRNSGKDLIQNHLTFYLFHHAALWPRDKWPVAIGVNGYVNVEVEKMSKSRGNIIPLIDLIKQYGADLVRINIAASSEGIDDANWRAEGIKGYRGRLEFVEEVARSLKKARGKAGGNAEAYLKGKMSKAVIRATENYERLKFRSAVHYALFEATNDLKWYLRRAGKIEKANRNVLTDAIEKIVKMIAPLTPHFCEEIWSVLGNRKSVFLSGWPQTNEMDILEEAEMGEDILGQTLSDIEEIRTLANVEKPKKARIFVAENWKFRVYSHVLRNKSRAVNEITKEIMATGSYGSATVAFIQSLYKKITELKPVLPRSAQLRLLEESKGFLERELGMKVEIVDAEKTREPKAKQAAPQKFGILLE